MTDKNFIWFAPQINGNVEDWYYSHTISNDSYPSIKKAFNAGLKELEHDVYDKIQEIIAFCNEHIGGE